MRKRRIAFCLCLLVALLQATGCIESEETLALARALYANCAQQSNETMYCFGGVICNRVGQAEFGQTLTSVLNQFGQFRTGARYDERTLRAAKTLLGKGDAREPIPGDVVYAVKREDDQQPYADKTFWRMSGDYMFYGDSAVEGK